MAEVIATFAAISSIVQILDFSARLVSCTRDILKNPSLSSTEQGNLAQLAETYKSITNQFAGYPDRQPSSEEQAVFRLQKECHEEAESLISSLEKLKISPGVTGIRKAKDGAKKVFLAFRERNELQRRHQNLEELNGLLGTSLLQLLLSRNEEQSKRVVSSLQNFEDMSDEMKVSKLNKGLNAIHRHILQSLSFGDMDTRVDTIGLAYPQTYVWAVQSEELGLKTWLESGNGIFWISGKAGSGKSTLMKCLARSIQTRKLLGSWANPATHSLTTTLFAFWYLGSSLQKSIEGLLRTILFSILDQVPALSAIAFPGLYDSISAPQRPSLWSCDALLEALQTVIRAASSTQRKFCFFIDGLDEYSGNQSRLIRLLNTLITTANVKLCVASRPWNAFRNAFESKVPSIQLEDLTRNDIRLYVEGSIGDEWSTARVSYGLWDEAQGDSNCIARARDKRHDGQLLDLVHAIVNKAEGVFLWVYLVVQSLASGLAEGDPIHMLRHRVDQCPSDLGEYFESILERVDKVYKIQTFQALKLACLHVEDKWAVDQSSWIDFWCLSRHRLGLLDERFLDNFEPEEVSESQLARMFNETRAFISASCKDLLHLRNMHSPWKPWGKVQFLHRTVHEYLSHHMVDFRSNMDLQVPDLYHTKRVLHLLSLARLKVIPECEDFNDRLDLIGYTATEMHHTPVDTYLVDTFESIINFHMMQYVGSKNICPFETRESFYWDFISIDLVELFVCFEKYTHVLGFLSAYVNEESSIKERCNHVPQDIILASLGLGSLRQFGIDSIHIPLIEALFEFGDILYIRITEPNGREYSIWEKFLLQWACSDKSLDLRHIWEVTKVFLVKKVPLHTTFHVAGSGRTDVGFEVEYEAKQFIKERIPSAWLSEVTNPCLLTECGHKPGAGHRTSDLKRGHAETLTETWKKRCKWDHRSEEGLSLDSR
jgi:hypothetical protein